MAYVLMFFMTGIFAYLADQYSRLGKDRRCKTFLFLTSVGPILMGALRNVNVGTDNLNYASRFLWAASKSSILDALLMGNFDIGFNALMFVVSRFTENYNWFCFVVSGLTFILLELSFWKMKDDVSFSTAVLTYLFIYYCSMYNLMRQGLALALCMYAFVCLIEKRNIRFFVFVGLAVLVHNISIVFFAVFIIYKYLHSARFWPRLLTVIIVSVGIIFSWRMLLSFALTHGIIKQKYAIYLTYQGGVLFSPGLTAFLLPMIAVTLLYLKQISYRYEGYKAMEGLVLLGVVLTQLSGLYGPMGRIGLYFLYPEMLMFGMIVKKNSGYNKIIVFGLIMIYVIGYWVFYTVLNNYGYDRPVYPYYTFLS